MSGWNILHLLVSSGSLFWRSNTQCRTHASVTLELKVCPSGLMSEHRESLCCAALVIYSDSAGEVFTAAPGDFLYKWSVNLMGAPGTQWEMLSHHTCKLSHQSQLTFWCVNDPSDVKSLTVHKRPVLRASWCPGLCFLWKWMYKVGARLCSDTSKLSRAKS